MAKKFTVLEKQITKQATNLEVVKFEYNLKNGTACLKIVSPDQSIPGRVDLTQEQFDELMPKIQKKVDGMVDSIAASLGGSPVEVK